MDPVDEDQTGDFPKVATTDQVLQRFCDFVEWEDPVMIRLGLCLFLGPRGVMARGNRGGRRQAMERSVS